MEVEGRIIEIFDTNQVTDSFKKREFAIEYADNPQYPENLLFQLIQDKCDAIDSFKVNDEVIVSFNLKGRKWTSPKGEVKYFNTLQAWRISTKQANQGGGNDGPPDFPEAPFNDAPPASNDDLPF